VYQEHLELSRVSNLAREQFNVLRALGTCECRANGTFLTVVSYKIYYLLILMLGDYWDMDLDGIVREGGSIERR
jgi:hypothetical protein